MSKKGLTTIIIVLIALGIGGFLFYSGKTNLNQKQLVSQSSPDTPEKIVEGYYNWYVDCENNYFDSTNVKGKLREVCPFNKDSILKEELIQKLNKAVAHDPILCSQNTPNGKVEVDKAIIAGDNAETTVHTYYDSLDNPIKVKLTLVGNSWRIEDINCQ